MQSQMEYREEAIPLVIYNMEKRLFEINDEAEAYLKSLPGPLGIISVAGMYRTGKSYLLNRMLLNRSGGFGVGPTINPCTKGVWIWGKPIDGITPDGDPIKVLVMDTEGLGALDEDSNHDVRIFSLAILLSSYFIYNSVGSIDENALSSLSLVINLTKHIHLKSTGLTEDIDPEEYGQYFPSFMWVVRDFALQLVDLEGEQMTSKEYFEKALQPQKGFTDAVEQKNRIRRLLKSFFQERDCCTMIRPLTKEENLQCLEKLPLDELRPEFVEQIMQLRRKVVNRIKPKMMHGKKLNGEMLFNLALSYVEAINKGVVPNIETAWSYICKNECQKAQYEAYDKFEKIFQENFELRSPVFDDELKEIYQQAKKAALEDFGKVAVGDIQKQFLVELKDKMRHKYKQFRTENTKVSEEQCLMFLQCNYVSIEKKLKEQQYQNIYDLVEELRNFQTYFIENGPPGPTRMVVLHEFINKSLVEASEFFFRSLENELFIQTSVSSETVHKLQSEIKEIKDEQKSKLENFENKIRVIETEKAEISAKEQSLKESLSQVMKERQHIEVEMSEKLETMKKDSQRAIEEYKNMQHQTEEQIKEVHRQRISAESEYDKQKALLEQKVEFYEKQLEEAQKKEKELNAEVKNQKKEHHTSYKESQKIFEQQIKDLQKKNEDNNEKLFEWETKYQGMESKYEQESQRWEDQEQLFKRELSKLKEANAEFLKQNDQLKKRLAEEIESIKHSSEEDKLLGSERIQELEQRCKNAEEQFEMAKQKWDKDQAIYKQKQEFLELQLKEERIKNDDQRQSHDQMIKNLQSRERESVIGKEESSKRIAQLSEQHSKEYQELEQKYDQQKQRLQTMNDQLQERNNELELSLKIQIKDFETEVATLRDQLKISEEQRIKAQDLIKNLDAEKIKLMEDSEGRYKLRLIELESEIEEKTREYDENIQEVQLKSEEQLNHLKQFFEIEKERLERRIQEEKDRAQKRYIKLQEEYEDKLREEQQVREEDVQNLQDEMAQKEAQMNDIIQQQEHDISLKHQQILSLEKYLQETKDSLNKIQSLSSSNMEQQLDKFNEERKELISKIEKLASEITKRERSITTLENQNDSLQHQMQQKEKALSDIRNDMNSEKNDLGLKIEQIRSKHQESLDDLTQRKIEFERDKALKAQQLQFQEQRINELTKQLEDTIRRYDERLKNEREELIRDMNDKIHRITVEKETSDQKYEQKRKALKDLETSINKQLSQMDREKAVMMEKYQNLELQQKELIKNYEAENLKLRETNDQLNKALTSDKQAIHEEVERWRNCFLDIERQFQDQNNNYDKDKALWEGKFKFLEQQKDTAKKDFEEAQRKFQMTIESLQKAQNDSKNKSEANHQMALASLETKYTQRIKELQESSSQMINELKSKIKQLVRENKQLVERMELTSKSKLTEQGGLEKKLEKLLEEKDRLQDEIETVKQDRDRKFQEYSQMLDKERENYKQKLRETEGKGTRVEAKQTELMLNFEKEKAKWEHEKGYLLSQKEDATEHSQRLEKKVENLLRENEKLKNDMRASKKNLYQATANTSTYQAAMIGNKLLNNIQSYKGTTMSGLAKGDGSGTERTGYQGLAGLSTQKVYSGFGDKSFQSSTSVSQGAVGGLNFGQPSQSNMLESSLLKNNLLSTPSSQKSGDQSANQSDYSYDDPSARKD